MIINADDFGYSPSVNNAIAECFKKGLINRTTIMVNMPECENAAKLSYEKGFFDKVGLHINLTEGKALSEKCASSPLCDENGFFKGIFHISFKNRLYLNKKIREAIYCEVEEQIKKYLSLGFTLLHADSHNYTHSYFSVYSSVKPLLKKYGFKSTRISRNVSEEEFSLPFKIYKSIFNFIIKNLKVNGRKINTTEFFCSVQDFNKSDNKAIIKNNVELMVHPDYINGELYDNTLPNPHPFINKEYIEKNELHLEDTSDKKIKLLVLFIHVHTGGAMTSLINFLNALDTDKYDVDVMFYEKGEGRYGIKNEINILPQAKTHSKYGFLNVLKKLVSLPYIIALIKDRYYKKIKKNKRKAVQIMSKEGCRYSRKINKEYDVCVAYEFNWCLNYMIKCVKAKKKISWHHVEYEKSGMDFNIDKKALDKSDALVFVSDECKISYSKLHPEHSKKAYFIPNLLSSAHLRKKAEEEISFPFSYDKYKDCLKFLSVARISFEHKGFDRAIRVFSKLKKEGFLENIIWVIIGDGRDYEKMISMIKEEKLENHIFPIGKKDNPIPYMKKFDALLLPSRHEGKPMVVTEGYIMGLVPVVTRYTSADEQIKNGIDGLVFDNNEEALYEGLKKLLKKPEVLDAMKKYISENDYGNEKEICYFDELIDKLI